MSRNYTRNNTYSVDHCTPRSLHVKCQETTNEIIPTYSVDNSTPGSLHVKCQETTHEIIPTSSLDHSTPGNPHVKCQETTSRNNTYILCRHTAHLEVFT